MSDSTNSDMQIAKPADFLVTRGENDELQPVTQPLPGVEQAIRVIPLTLGEMNRYDFDDPEGLTSEELAEILNAHWYDVAIDDSLEITAEQIDEDLIAFGKDALVTAILRASGYDMQNAMNMEVFDMIAGMDSGKFERLMELASAQNDDTLSG